MRVAFQGDLGAYSELAARVLLGRDIRVLPKAGFEDVFESVSSGESECGIIPIENSQTGSIYQNYDLLLEYNLRITGEIKLRVSHNLMANPGVTLGDLKRVYSHPQALAQCEHFLSALGDVEAVPVYDTAGAARMIKEKGVRDGGAVASSEAASKYGLDILAKAIETNRRNYTRFLLVSLTEADPPADAKTSIVYGLPNTPGTLYTSLSVFAKRQINLLKLESRPLRRERLWEYVFYLDLEGGIQDPLCREALQELSAIATSLRILGCYSKGTETDGVT